MTLLLYRFIRQVGLWECNFFFTLSFVKTPYQPFLFIPLFLSRDHTILITSDTIKCSKLCIEDKLSNNLDTRTYLRELLIKNIICSTKILTNTKNRSGLNYGFLVQIAQPIGKED